MKKYGVILKNGEGIRVLRTCYSKEAAIIAVQLQKNIHSPSEGLIAGILGDFDREDHMLSENWLDLCA